MTDDGAGERAMRTAVVKGFVALFGVLGGLMWHPQAGHALELHLDNGEVYRVEQVVYHEGVLAGESAVSRLTMPRERLRFVAWDSVPSDVGDPATRILLADGSLLTGWAREIRGDQVIAETPYGTLVLNDVKQIRSVGFVATPLGSREAGLPPTFEFHLEDGSLVRGELLGYDGSTFVVATPHGQLQVSTAKVAFFRSYVVEGRIQAGWLYFSNGDRLRGRLRAARADQWLIDVSGGHLIVHQPGMIAAVGVTGIIRPSQLPRLGQGQHGQGGPARLRPAIVSRIELPRLVGAITISPDGKRAYVAASGGVSVIDLVRKEKVSHIEIGGARALALSPDGSRLYVAGHGNWHDGRFAAFDLQSGRELASIRFPRPAYSLAVAPDGRFAYVSLAGEYGPEIIDLDRMQHVGRLRYSTSNPVAISADGQVIVAPGSDVGTWTLDVWQDVDPYVPSDPVARIRLTRFRGHSNREPHPIAIAPDGRFAYVGSGWASFVAVDLERKEEAYEVDVPPVDAIALSPDGRYAYLTSQSLDIVAILDLQQRAWVNTVRVKAPIDLAVNPRDGVVWVTTSQGLVGISPGVEVRVPDLVVRWNGPPLAGVVTFLSNAYLLVVNEDGEHRLPLSEVKAIHLAQPR